MSVLIDLTGKKFGRLTVLCREGTYQRPSGNKEPTWRCVCECGNEIVVLSSNLKKKNTLSCGCLQSENRNTPRRETAYKIIDGLVHVDTYSGETFIVNECDLESVVNHRWRTNDCGYPVDEHGNTIHRFLMNPPDGMDVHHINENKLDNRRRNLLMLTRSEHTSLHNTGKTSNGVTVQQWISVEDRLPKPEENPVLAVFYGVVNPAWCYGSKWELPSHFITDDVTHWMPLPEPPKEG